MKRIASRVVARIDGLSLRSRIGIAAVVLGAGLVGTLALAAGGGGDTDLRGKSGIVADSSQRPHSTPTAAGRVIRAPGGKLIRVAPDGQTLLDAQGRPLRGPDGKVLRLGPDGKLPKELELPRKIPGTLARAPIAIGLAYPKASQLNGISASQDADHAFPEQEDPARAVVAHINATGGIGGHPVVLRAREMALFDGRPGPVHMQEACEFFTARDQKPLAVIGQSGFYYHELSDCLADRDVALLTYHPAEAATARFNRHPGHRFAPGSLAIDRFPGAYVRALDGAGFFNGRGRIGLIRLGGYSDLESAAGELKAALRNRGHRLEQEVVVPRVVSSADLAGYLAAWVGGPVRMNLAGVTKVLTIDSGGFIYLFMRAAEAQGYRPRYGLNTTAQPLVQESMAPRAQLRGSVGIGWSPLADVAGRYEGPMPAARAECARIFERARARIGNRDAGEAVSAYAICDSLLAIRAAAERAGEVSRAGIHAGFSRLGSGFQSGMAHTTRLDGGRRDGAAGYRALAFDDGCRCFRYDGPVRPID